MALNGQPSARRGRCRRHLCLHRREAITVPVPEVPSPCYRNESGKGELDKAPATNTLTRQLNVDLRPPTHQSTASVGNLNGGCPENPKSNEVEKHNREDLRRTGTAANWLVCSLRLSELEEELFTSVPDSWAFALAPTGPQVPSHCPKHKLCAFSVEKLALDSASHPTAHRVLQRKRQQSSEPRTPK